MKATVFSLFASAALLALVGLASAAEPRPRVTADARMDLMGLVQALSGAPGIPSNPFTDKAVKRFARDRKHPAVLGAAAMRARGAGPGLLMQYAVYLSTPPDLIEDPRAPGYFENAFGGRAALDAWRADLSAFARESGFMAWEDENRAQREAFADAVRRAQGGRDLDAPLRRLLGARTWGDWIVFVSPFFTPGGSDSWIVEEKKGLPLVAVLYGPFWSGKSFGGGRPDEFAAAAWSEAIFTMTYAVYEACRPQVRLTSAVCRDLPGLVNIEDCVQHYWVRELLASQIEETFGAEAGRVYRARGQGPYDDAARAAIASYRAGRPGYRDLMDASAPLFAPFMGDAAPVACRVDDPGRADQTAYARRMAYYRQARSEP